MVVANGVSEMPACVIWRVVAEACVGRFDALAAHAELVAAGYTSLEADMLVEEMLERLAGRQSVDPDRPETRWLRQESEHAGAGSR
jgi:hypothetical protein